MIECEDCRRFEAPLPTRASVARDMLLAGIARLPLFRPSPASQMISSMGMVMSLTLGSAVREPTWYEKHRQAWIETGDLAELDRMLRHPLPPLPAYKPTAHRSRNWPLPVIAVPLTAIVAGAVLAAAVWLVSLTGWLW